MRSRGANQFVALLCALAMLATACSGSDSGSSGEESAAESSGVEEASTATPTTVVATETTVVEAASGPVSGGRLVYGVEADSANPWAHYRTSCAISCYAVLSSISDPLFATLDGGGSAPNLVETSEHSDDYMEWTWTIREGISFHDGTPLDGAAVAFNINSCRFSSLTGAALGTIADVQAEGQTVTFTLATPWVPFNQNFSGGQCSYMLSPTWLGSLADIPFRTEGAPFFSEALAATPATGDPAAPVGLGAFVFESYTPGNANSFVAVKNADYWRGPNGITGEELPYLDSVEIVVAVDIASRSSAVESGQFSIVHTANADEIKRFQDGDEFTVIAANDFGDTSYILLNHAAGTNATLGGADMDPDGTNASNPLVHLSCRKALAHATDNDRLAAERGAGIVAVANGPFPPGSIGYLEDTGYPKFDIAAAQTEMEQCKVDAGTDVIQFAHNTTNDSFNVETNQLIQSMWKEAFGDDINVSLVPIEQGQYIGLALFGAFQAQGWRQHAGTDPDTQFLWWHSGAASPAGAIALNFGRIQDPVIDENLVIQRVNPDPAARLAAAEAINRSFGENVWYLWNTWTLWGVIASPRVQAITTATVATGEATHPFIAGRHGIAQIWCLEGSCSE